MAILGVLLGITMTVLGYFVYQFRDNAELALELFKSLTERVEFLERRKALLTEAAGSYQVPGVGNVANKATKPRTWNEDVAAADTK